MVYIVDFGSTKSGEIEAVVSSFAYPNLCVKWKETDVLTMKKASKIILSGAPVLLTETSPEPFLEKFAFLKSIPVPVLGICFGHQLLGLLHGATVFKGKEVRNSIPVDILQPDPIFLGVKTGALFKEDHTEGISLPDGFVHLAKSADYQIEAMKHPFKSIYGVQFHPEVSFENGRQLLKNFCIHSS